CFEHPSSFPSCCNLHCSQFLHQLHCIQVFSELLQSVLFTTCSLILLHPSILLPAAICTICTVFASKYYHYHYLPASNFFSNFTPCFAMPNASIRSSKNTPSREGD
ncbi:unnamed protein product, partial [Sphacelaria rigidula]